MPQVVFRERNAIAGRLPFISDIPTKACPLMQRMPILAVDSWTALEKPNCSPSGTAARSPMDFEERNYLYVVGEWDEGGSGLTAHHVAMAGVTRGSVRQKGRFPLKLPRCQPWGLSCFVFL